MARLNDSDRGQVALIGAFAIAVLLVVLAIVLSSAIEVEALASRGDGPASTDVLRYHDETVRTIDSLASRTYVDDATCEADVTAGVDRWGDLAARHAAADGALLTVTPDSVDCTGGTVTVTYTFTYTTPTLSYESTATRVV